MKFTAVVIAFLFVWNLQVVHDLQAFPGDQPEEFESIIPEKPWVFQISLIDKEGISMRQSYNYTLNAGKYFSKNVILRAGINFGKGNGNADQNASSSGSNPMSSFRSEKSDTYKYGGTLDALYNFMPDNRLQLLLGVSIGYEYSKAERNSNSSYERANYEKARTDIFRGGIAASINFFVYKQMSLYIENKIYYSRNKFTSDHVSSEVSGEYRSHSRVSSNNVTFDNLLLGIGFYF